MIIDQQRGASTASRIFDKCAIAQRAHASTENTLAIIVRELLEEQVGSARNEIPVA